MKNLPIFVFAVFAASVQTAYCSTVTFGAVPTARQVVDATNINTLITNASSLVLAGTFANESFSLDSSASLAANVASATSSGGWKQFGLDTSTLSLNDSVTNTLALNGSGRVGGGITDNTVGPTKANFFNGKNLYLWIFNASSVGAATQMGIFRATNATTAWEFPTNGGGVGDSTTYSTVPLNAPTIAAIGGFGSIAGSNLQLTNSFNITPVPEPSAFTFGLLTLCAAAYLPRRRR